MAQHIVIIGAGFAGLMAALSAARLRDEKGISPEDLKITVVSPEPALVVRPRLYEPNPGTMVAPLTELFAATDMVFHAGSVGTLDAERGMVTVVEADGTPASLFYDRLIIASGSHGFQPPIPGLSEFGHSVTDRDGAVELEQHLQGLSKAPLSASRNTVVVGGGGFTGIEVATEMPSRLREILGQNEAVRVIIVERGPVVAPDMGVEPRPYIEARLRDLGIETVLGSGIARLDQGSVTLENGERIETDTVIWSAGMRASPLTAQLSADRDNLGRILVEPDLRVPGDRLYAEKGTSRIDPELGVIFGEGDLRRRSDRVDAGVRHVDVRAAETITNEVRNLAMMIDIGDIALDRDRRRADCPHGLVKGLLSPPRNQYMGALLCKESLTCEPDTAVAAGDHGHLSTQTCHALPLMLKQEVFGFSEMRN